MDSLCLHCVVNLSFESMSHQSKGYCHRTKLWGLKIIHTLKLIMQYCSVSGKWPLVAFPAEFDHFLTSVSCLTCLTDPE